MKGGISRRWEQLKQKKLTLLVVPLDGARTKSWVVSYATLTGILAVSVMSLLLIIGLFTANWMQARRLSDLTLELEKGSSENASLKAQIQAQEKQLNDLYLRIANMESHLVDMNDVSAQIYEVLEQLGVDTQSLPPLALVTTVMGTDDAQGSNEATYEDSEKAEIDKSVSAQGGPILEQVYDAVNVLEEVLPAQITSLSQVKEVLEEERYRMEHTPSIWPAEGWVSSGFGRRKDPFTGKNAYHEGIDIANHKGTPVYATAAGKVTYAGYMSGYGNLVIIDHDFDIETRYGHLDKILVSRGEKVAKGQQIGTMGNTGRSTGPHVHYEVRVKKKPVSPFRYLPDRS